MLKNLPLLLFAIIILGAFLRFFYLNNMPPSLNWDEVSHGYNAYSILKTGKDEWGTTLPTLFRAFGDYKLPAYIYLTIPSIVVFGLNAWAVRFPSALAGVIIILFTYLLTKKLINKNTALLTALLVAIEPWSFFVSRAAFEANVCLMFIITGVYFFLKGLENKRYFILSSILLGLSVWTYNSARVFVPMLIVGLLFIYRRYFRTFLYMLPAVIFLIPMFLQLINPTGQARYGAIQILDSGAISTIVNLRNSSSLPSLLPKLIFNKVTYLIVISAKQYLAHFGLDFLFIRSGTDYQFSIPGHGVLYLIDLPFVVFGLFYVLRNIKTKSYQLILCWLVLSPIASSITRDSPHVLRSLVMLPIPMILTAIGVTVFLKNRIFLCVYIILLFIFIGDYLNIYATSYLKNYSQSWQYGYEEVVNYIKANYSNFDEIITTKAYGEPHEFFLFFLQYDPAKYTSDPNLIRFYQSDWYWIDHFDKFWFINDWQIKTNPLWMNSIQESFITESKHTVNCNLKKCLLITTPQNTLPGWKELERINFLDGREAFVLESN
jgi:4-amino-4-deoxy-L-arabinose transferase-like glycosyltransferase